MDVIQPAPELGELSHALREIAAWRELPSIIKKANDDYLYWDKVKYMEFPSQLTPEDAWKAIKVTRLIQMSRLPLKDVRGRSFGFWLPDSAQQPLHYVDTQAGGQIGLDTPIMTASSKRRYLVSSLMEEAIASSQIEGAATTRKVAKEFLRSGRKPSTHAEKMVINNYRTIQRILELRTEPLSAEMVFELQRSMTEGTLDREEIGRLRRTDEPIHVVHQGRGQILHTPPPARELADRLDLMCEFANSERRDPRFIHPIVKGILLHFWLAYDHPFVNGNGRTARALFYWYVLARRYWLFEYLSISKAILRSRGQYEQAYLQAEHDDQDATYFVMYHLRAIEKALRSLQTYLERKQREYQQMASLLKTDLWLNYRQQALLRHALANPGFEYTIRSHMNSHRVSYPTARSDLLALADRGFLSQRTIGRMMYFTTAPDLDDRLRTGGR